MSKQFIKALCYETEGDNTKWIYLLGADKTISARIYDSNIDSDIYEKYDINELENVSDIPILCDIINIDKNSKDYDKYFKLVMTNGIQGIIKSQDDFFVDNMLRYDRIYLDENINFIDKL